jgi:hypothetical protein
MVSNHFLKVIIISLFLSILLFAKTYSEEDWKVYNGCKERVYNNIDNNLDKNVCKYVLEDKENLKKYGAEYMYNYYIEKLYYFK